MITNNINLVYHALKDKSVKGSPLVSMWMRTYSDGVFYVARTEAELGERLQEEPGPRRFLFGISRSHKFEITERGKKWLELYEAHAPIEALDALDEPFNFKPAPWYIRPFAWLYHKYLHFRLWLYERKYGLPNLRD